MGTKWGLLGTDEATLDEKGRLLVSKKKRDRLGENFTITIGPAGCLAAYPEEEWDEVVQSLRQYDSLNLGRDFYTRLVFGSAEDDLKFDAQGRIVIPQKLREMARFKEKGQVLLVGCGDRLEFWAKEEYAKFLADKEGYGKEWRDSLLQAQKLMKES